MEIFIDTQVKVDGITWWITTKHSISEDLSGENKIKRLHGIIRGLATAGLTARFAAPTEKPVQIKLPEPGSTREGKEQAGPGFTWSTPPCPEHKEEMSPSQVQKKEGFIAYFCPKKGEASYCLHRSMVDAATGLVKFWEVRG